MKKLFFILLSFFYLMSSAGATVQFHYCMDRLVGAGMHHDESDECSKCGMKKQDGCCKDESKYVKVESNHKPSSKFLLSYYLPTLSQEIFFDVFQSLFLQAESRRMTYHYISPSHFGKLYKYFCIFRI